jgi:hypothetical protein
MLLLEARMTTIVIIVLSLITARLVLVQFLPWCAYLVFCAWLVKRTDDPKALDHAASAAKAYPLRPLLWHRNDQPVESGLSQRTLGVLAPAAGSTVRSRMSAMRLIQTIKLADRHGPAWRL